MAEVDHRVLERLVDDLDGESVDQLVRTFLDALPARRASIAESAMTGDLAAARRVGHQLRSTALLVGAATLSEASSRLESHAAAGDLDGAQRAAGDISRLCPEVARELQAWLTR